MKYKWHKVILIPIIVIFGLVLQIDALHGTVKADDTVVESTETSKSDDNSVDDEPNVLLNTSEETISWDQLSSQEKALYSQSGYNSTDTFFKEVTDQNSQLRGWGNANVVTMTGSTKKMSSTTAKTTYVMTSGKPLLSINVRLTQSPKNRYFDSSHAPKSTAYMNSITSTFTGKKTYLTMKLSTQYTTSLGKGTVSCTAGGATLGR